MHLTYWLNVNAVRPHVVLLSLGHLFGSRLVNPTWHSLWARFFVSVPPALLFGVISTLPVLVICSFFCLAKPFPAPSFPIFLNSSLRIINLWDYFLDAVFFDDQRLFMNKIWTLAKSSTMVCVASGSCFWSWQVHLNICTSVIKSLSVCSSLSRELSKVCLKEKPKMQKPMQMTEDESYRGSTKGRERNGLLLWAETTASHQAKVT